MQLCAQQALIGSSTSSFVQFRSPFWCIAVTENSLKIERYLILTAGKKRNNRIFKAAEDKVKH